MTQQPPLPQLPPSNVVFENGKLISHEFDDIYFSTQDGFEETEHVFIHGTQLPRHLSGAPHLTIAETGFGTGLNLCAVIAWLKKTESKCKVSYISFEASPLDADIAKQALSAFPHLGDIAAELICKWPPRWPGVHHLILCDGQVELTVHYGQAEAVLPSLDFKADIWFLDGFSPAKNQSIWSDDVLHHVGRCSHRGTKLASFTVARAVRESLTNAGFNVERQAGYGRKRHMLVAEMQKGLKKLPRNDIEHVLIIGGGVAGCAVAHQLARLGISHQLMDGADRLASHASGNPAGFVMPQLSVGDNLPSRLSISAFADAINACTAADAVLDEKIISLDIPEMKKIRQQKLAVQNYPDDLARYLTAKEIAEYIGCDAGVGGMIFARGLVIDPIKYCHYLASESPTLLAQNVEQVVQVETKSGSSAWEVKTTKGKTIIASHIVLCAGHQLPQLLTQFGMTGGRFQITSGQVSMMQPQSRDAVMPALNFGGYLAKFGNQAMLGASYSHDLTTQVSEKGHQFNFDLLPPALHHFIDTDLKNWGGRTAYRLATEFRMPICEPSISQRNRNISVLGALGSRGLTYGNYLARYLTGQIAGRPSFLSRKLCDAMQVSRAFGVDF